MILPNQITEIINEYWRHIFRLDLRTVAVSLIDWNHRDTIVFCEARTYLNSNLAIITPTIQPIISVMSRVELNNGVDTVDGSSVIAEWWTST